MPPASFADFIGRHIVVADADPTVVAFAIRIVKDVAAAGGRKDITTLINCYQQPDEDTLRAVVEFMGVTRQWRAEHRWHQGTRTTRTVTHTPPQIGKSATSAS
jgi:hypothetical protein